MVVYRCAESGSGFMSVSSQGYIVTNNHVIDRADEIIASGCFDDRREFIATVIGRDPENRPGASKD